MQTQTADNTSCVFSSGEEEPVEEDELMEESEEADEEDQQDPKVGDVTRDRVSCGARAV